MFNIESFFRFECIICPFVMIIIVIVVVVVVVVVVIPLYKI